jgi:hypothetical protein
VDCVKVTLFVSERSKYLERILRSLLPRNSSLLVINIDRSEVATPNIRTTPLVVVATRTSRETFYGFDKQRVTSMLAEAVKQGPSATWSSANAQPRKGRTHHHRSHAPSEAEGKQLRRRYQHES